MRAAALLLVAACGGYQPWKPLPPAAPHAFCPALAKGDLQLAAAAASTRHRAVGGGSDSDPAVTFAFETWLRAQPCVIAVEDDRCNGLDGVVFQTRERHVQVVLYPTAVQLNPTPPCTQPGPLVVD